MKARPSLGCGAASLAVFVALTAFFVFIFIRTTREFNDAMFAPKPRDATQMAKVLSNRFGSRVTLIKVPFVDRDINGTVGMVNVAANVPMQTYTADGFVLSLERQAGRTICFMAIRQWELDRVRKNYFARHGSLSQ